MPHVLAGTETQKIKTQFEIMSVPYLVVKMDYSRGARHGLTQWQDDHWKAEDAKPHAEKKKHDSIVLRWRNDDKYHLRAY